jgi:NAD(P) transhydrogenase
MVVIGGGAVACGYAGIFAALGTRVTLVSRSRLFAQLDPEISDALRNHMTRQGMRVFTGVEIAEVLVDGKRGYVTLLDGTVLVGDCVLQATGRCGETAELMLDRIGVATDRNGFIAVDSHFCTAAPGVMAVGDVIGPPALASLAMEQARVAICHAFDLRYKQQVAPAAPYAAWTIPEVAAVGESPERLAARGQELEFGRATYAQNTRGAILGGGDGFLKLTFDPANLRLLGVAIVGEDAGELIHVGATCIAEGGTIDRFIQDLFTHPSLSELYKYAAYDGLQATARRYGKHPGLAAIVQGASLPID